MLHFSLLVVRRLRCLWGWRHAKFWSRGCLWSWAYYLNGLFFLSGFCYRHWQAFFNLFLLVFFERVIFILALVFGLRLAWFWKWARLFQETFLESRLLLPKKRRLLLHTMESWDPADGVFFELFLSWRVVALGVVINQAGGVQVNLNNLDWIFIWNWRASLFCISWG